MFLRSNRILKFLVLLLFTFELMVPVYATGISVEESAYDQAGISSVNFHQGLFSPLLLEELNESEEEKDDHKGNYSGSDFSAFELRHISFDIHHVSLSSYISSHQRSPQSAPLFQLHCKLLI